MMLGGFSHSTGVGKLWQELLDVHSDVCFKFSWYTVDEEETVCNYYLRRCKGDKTCVALYGKKG
uniref:Uncharacterized protein n=1 Tax=Aegilops tauschii subsp. strangulata TaxID=200361 RepID=A0A453T7X6_AEGTS